MAGPGHGHRARAAHNEEFSLPVTPLSLLQQTRRPTGSSWSPTTAPTAPSTWRWASRSFETVGNTHKKGGALNQALAHLLPGRATTTS